MFVLCACPGESSLRKTVVGDQTLYTHVHEVLCVLDYKSSVAVAANCRTIHVFVCVAEHLCFEFWQPKFMNW